MILMGTVTAQRELHIRFKENILISKRSLLTEDAIVRSGAEGEIVTVNPTFRSARNFDLVEFLFKPAAISGWKFYAGEQDRRGGEVWFEIDRNCCFVLELKCSSAR